MSCWSLRLSLQSKVLRVREYAFTLAEEGGAAISMRKSEEYRQQAQSCLELANAVEDQFTKEAMEELATEFLKAADRLEEDRSRGNTRTNANEENSGLSRQSGRHSGRSPHWIKSKNPNAPAVTCSQCA
jgi:hypothetical protein